MKQLSLNPSSYPSGLTDKMLMAFLKEDARLSANNGFFEKLHVDFWKGRGGEVFASNCNHRFNDLFLVKQVEDFQLLQDYWKKGSYKHIVEIGCCAGLHLQHLTTNLHGVESAIGIDINPVQIQANNENRAFDTRIEFVAADGGNWILENGQPNTLFVTNGGVLEYFSQQRLNEILCHVANKLSPAIFFVVEPVAADYDTNRQQDSIPFGEELSFSHNYRHLYEANGFRVLHERPVEFDSWRMMTTVAEFK